MKPKEYRKVYRLEETPIFNRDDFIEQLFADFNKMLVLSSTLKTQPSQKDNDLSIQTLNNVNLAKYENALKDIRKKWDLIFTDTRVAQEESEKFFGYFYAAFIIPTRDLIFGEDFIKAKVDYLLKYGNREKNSSLYGEYDYDDDTYTPREEILYKRLGGKSSYYSENERSKTTEKIPTLIRQSMRLLGFQDSILDLAELKSKYRVLAIRFHPDLNHGAETTQFVKLKKAYEDIKDWKFSEEKI